MGNVRGTQLHRIAMGFRLYNMDYYVNKHFGVVSTSGLSSTSHRQGKNGLTYSISKCHMMHVYT